MTLPLRSSQTENYFGVLAASLLILCLTGCTTLEMREEVFEPEKGGVVQFSNSPSTRKEALALAQKFCRGPVKIQAEGDEWIPASKGSTLSPPAGDRAMNNSDDEEEDTGLAASPTESTGQSVASTPSAVRGSKSADVLFLKFRCALQRRRN